MRGGQSVVRVVEATSTRKNGRSHIPFDDDWLCTQSRKFSVVLPKGQGILAIATLAKKHQLRALPGNTFSRCCFGSSVSRSKVICNKNLFQVTTFNVQSLLWSIETLYILPSYCKQVTININSTIIDSSRRRRPDLKLCHYLLLPQISFPTSQHNMHRSVSQESRYDESSISTNTLSCISHILIIKPNQPTQAPAFPSHSPRPRGWCVRTYTRSIRWRSQLERFWHLDLFHILLVHKIVFRGSRRKLGQL